MCEVSEEIFKEGREEGRAEGREEGRVEGREEGRVEGREEGRTEEKRETAIKLFKMGMSVEMIAEAVRASIKLVQEWVSGNGNPTISPAQ